MGASGLWATVARSPAFYPRHGVQKARSLLLSSIARCDFQVASTRLGLLAISVADFEGAYMMLRRASRPAATRKTLPWMASVSCVLVDASPCNLDVSAAHGMRRRANR